MSMDSFEKLADRLNGIAWGKVAEDYSPSPAEMEAVIHYLKVISDLACRDNRQMALHALASPAQMLGYVPSMNVAKSIDDQAAQIADAYAKILVKNAMEWADMVSNGELPSGCSSDLFEPLLALLEHGCIFRLSKGFLEVGDKVIPIHRWPVLSTSI
jgi:hypothetical protein